MKKYIFFKKCPVFICHITKPLTAHLVRSILESHDIPCFVMDHMNGSMNWDINGATRLMIMQSDFEAAKKLLEEEDINLEQA